MYINRAQALLLVGTISAGCASANDEEGGSEDGVAASGGLGLAGSDGQLQSSVGGGASTGGTAGAQSGGGGASAGGTAGAQSAGGAPSGGGAGGLMNVAGTTSEGSLTCDDNAATLVDCAALQATACEGLESFLSVECEMVASVMKPAIANFARTCIVGLAPPDLCDATNTYACIEEALSFSCPDAEADDECTIIATACDESFTPTFAACTTFLSGMTQGGRDQMVQCMAEFCDLHTCIEGLSYPANE